ncbi:hypothetical protein C5952_00430 [Cronobacter sakazakii]|uniref:hypothetical protein n=1 Tax=Cronobacter sakazakii TaxID=28141 RepID=UPI000CFD595E|nr:hypothetical protein [Cronobacter sakazakii]HDC4441793.1 hypothetical protein [Enterobacter cloacae]ELY6361628.1 hypothetical protein [Cronobacter sakazakii]ELY6363982.1 hypothetical protein [Cronobacter sakazakii]PQX69276.1 hypothetical protein C5952_00430 [Cronobacter sakazakii]PQY05154.1 hypothetical protein C5936_13460 [Cronobacter sakazakii]
MTEKTENNSELTISGKFEMLPVEALSLLGKKIRTPDGRVEKIDGDDLVWWMFFFTFLHQKTPCYQTRKTISDRFDCDERTVSRRTARLEELGLLTIEKRKGTSSIYTATSVEQFLLMKTDQKVTPKEESNGDKTNKKPATVASASATNDPEQQPSVSWSAGDSSDDVPANDAVNHDDITIFDENGVVTEEFINALSGDAAPNRNTDGSLQSIKYVYWVARHSQDEREGITVRTCEEYMAEARPEHIPAHLLPKEHRAEPKPEPMCDLSEEDLPF